MNLNKIIVMGLVSVILALVFLDFVYVVMTSAVTLAAIIAEILSELSKLEKGDEL